MHYSSSHPVLIWRRFQSTVIQSWLGETEWCNYYDDPWPDEALACDSKGSASYENKLCRTAIKFVTFCRHNRNFLVCGVHYPERFVPYPSKLVCNCPVEPNIQRSTCVLYSSNSLAANLLLWQRPQEPQLSKSTYLRLLQKQWMGALMCAADTASSQSLTCTHVRGWDWW